MSEEIVHDPSRLRYELTVDGELGAYAEYELEGSTIVFTHTVTTPQLRGRGLAGKVVRQALDDARTNGRRVVPQCWYVAQYIEQHDEYADLLADTLQP
jgi:predicted GNAT family acetyltransferase